MNNLPKDLVSHPGEMLKDILEGLNMSPVELANVTGFDIGYISTFLLGMADITEEFAVELEKVFSISKNLWLEYQNDYNKFKTIR